ncbi:MAG: heparan-alpha-glucosaminide N-acetyltransferase domain-containing protein [Candidatus Kapaibacteriota bacterium]
MAQSQRLFFLDLMRVIAMVMMIMGHSFFDLVRSNLVDVTQFPWIIWEFLRGLTAPIFLVVSGIVQVFANKRVGGKLPKDIVFRRIRTALLLIFLAYFLNFPVQKAFHIFFQSKSLLVQFFQVNILQLIGVTLLWVLCYFLVTKDNRQLGVVALVTAVVIFALTPIVHLIDWYKFLPLPIAPYFSLAKGSYFTIFPFAGFLFFGVAFGTFLERYALEERSDVIIKYGLKYGLVLLPIGTIIYIAINFLNLPLYDVFKGNPGMAIIRLSCVGILASVVVWLYKMYLHNLNWVKKLSLTLGKNALFVYVVHLIILYGLPWYPGFASLYYKSFGIAQAFIISVLIVFLSFTLVFVYEVETSKRRFVRLVFKYGTVSLLVLLVLV